MKCEASGFEFLVKLKDRQSILSRLQKYKFDADFTDRTYAVRLAQSNYYTLELTILPKAIYLLTVSTTNRANNINLKSLDMLYNLTTLSCCASQNEQFLRLANSVLSGESKEIEIVDLMDNVEQAEFEVDCSQVRWNEIKVPEATADKWTSIEVATLGNLRLKVVRGKSNLIAISTERPQNSIKFASVERLQSLCCFLNQVKQKMEENKALIEVLKPLLKE